MRLPFVASLSAAVMAGGLVSLASGGVEPDLKPRPTGPATQPSPGPQSSDERQDLLGRLHAAGMPEAAIIGKVLGSGSGRVLLRTNGRRPIRLALSFCATIRRRRLPRGLHCHPLLWGLESKRPKRRGDPDV